MSKINLLIFVLIFTAVSATIHWDYAWYDRHRPFPNGTEIESPPSASYLKNVCPPPGILTVECKDKPTRKVFNGTVDRPADHYRARCDPQVGLICKPYDNVNAKCPDFSIHFGCDKEDTTVAPATTPSLANKVTKAITKLITPQPTNQMGGSGPGTQFMSTKQTGRTNKSTPGGGNGEGQTGNGYAASTPRGANLSAGSSTSQTTPSGSVIGQTGIGYAASTPRGTNLSTGSSKSHANLSAGSSTSQTTPSGSVIGQTGIGYAASTPRGTNLSAGSSKSHTTSSGSVIGQSASGNSASTGPGLQSGSTQSNATPSGSMKHQEHKGNVGTLVVYDRKLMAFVAVIVLIKQYLY